jgi:hypothetical protein
LSMVDWDCGLLIVRAIDNPQSQSTLRSQLSRQSSIRNLHSLGLLLLLKASAEREMQIHPLHALLGLHPDERRSSGVQRKLTL